jgi:hypothetical protein
LVDLGDLVIGSSEADLKPFNFTDPAFTLGFGNPSEQIVPDLDNPFASGRIRPVHTAP